ncbi:Hpt domain-containing protein [Lutimaribacter pacificus]|uniref:Hpt domain-containing protein n=1 Tax=Lutimaribacter pacificus TaxID=391948 RepID=A0A1H0BHQ3_9RHOB|nr:Hpt domain-containing protein [Lutimaribacter pacificus]SDN45169.1 Hpt domain-containing protein [Lutimaribacter pacificus]SHJ55980.1 Hpt domain-containing protein [Lutimaribacter pacificus]
MNTAEAPDPARALDLAIDGLRAKFLRDLDERIFTFEEAMARLRAGRDGAEAMRHIHRLAHRQAGIAPSLGFPRIGELSREVETGIAAALAAPEDAHKQRVWRASLELLVDEMERHLPEIDDAPDASE